MRVIVDVNAIRRNAGAVVALCRQVGLTPVGVIKAAYAMPSIIEAFVDGGFSRFMISPSASLECFPDAIKDSIEVLGPLGPGCAAGLPMRFVGSSHCSRESLSAVATVTRSGSPHHCWLSLLTDDNREGFDATAAVQLARDWKTLFGARLFLKGLLANFGCGPSGTVEELNVLNAVAIRDHIRDELGGSELGLSVGGSALLPHISNLAPHLRGADFRVGEAVVSGTLPSSGSVSPFALQSSVRLAAEILQVRSPTSGTEHEYDLLIDAGYTSFDQAELESSGLGIRASSECSVVRGLRQTATPRAGGHVELPLGYKSAVRALSNRHAVIDLSSTRP